MEECPIDDEDTADTADSEDDQIKSRKAAKPATARQRWSQAEEEEIIKYFKSHLDAGIAPRAKDCEKAKDKSRKASGQLHKRASHLIVKKISAMNHRRK